MEPQGREGCLQGRQYDLAENHRQLTLVMDLRMCEVGGVGEWAEFLLWMLSEEIRLFVDRRPA